jgi:hypothetical protein
VLAIRFSFPSVAASVVAVARDSCCARERCGCCLLDAGGASPDAVGRFLTAVVKQRTERESASLMVLHRAVECRCMEWFVRRAVAAYRGRARLM